MNMPFAMIGLWEAALIFGTLLPFMVVNAIVCFLVSSWLGKVPQPHRKMDPGLVWLLMIPCFSLVWNFVVIQRVPESFKSHFDSVGKTDVGDCGKGIGLGYAICSAVCVVPFLGYVAFFAALVLLILLLVKFSELKNQIP